METREFQVRARLEAHVVEAWIEAGWLIPQHAGRDRRFSEIDVARAQLIHDLRQDFGVNDEAVPIILDLLDQMHGLRRTLAELLDVVRNPPKPRRRGAEGRPAEEGDGPTSERGRRGPGVD